MRYLTDQELNVGSRFLFLSMAIVVIQQDIENIQNGNFKIKEPYTGLLKKMGLEAANERRQLQKTMKNSKMKVVKLNKNDSFSSFMFYCNGREEKRNYFNPAIRKKVETIIEELMVNSVKGDLPPLQSDFYSNT